MLYTSPASLWREGILQVKDSSPRHCPIDGQRIENVLIDTRTVPNPQAPPFEAANFEALPEADGTICPCMHTLSQVRRVLRCG